MHRLLAIGLLTKKQGTEADLLLALVQVIMGILELPCRALMENVIEYFDGGF